MNVDVGVCVGERERKLKEGWRTKSEERGGWGIYIQLKDVTGLN